MDDEKKTVTLDMKKEMISTVGQLTEQQQLEIYYIISEKTDEFTENNNGIYINLENIDDSILEEIYKYIDFCKRSNAILIDNTLDMLVPPEPLNKKDGKIKINHAISKIVYQSDEESDSEEEGINGKIIKMAHILEDSDDLNEPDVNPEDCDDSDSCEDV